MPRYRQKVVFPLFAMAHPTWEDDPAFDIRNHVVELALPAPGDDRALSEIGGRAFAGMLDRDHPLWKLIVVQGRADGNTAVIWKVHHAMIDGVSGVDLTMVLHDLKPDAPPPCAAVGALAAARLFRTRSRSCRTRSKDRLHRGNPGRSTDDAFRLLRPTQLEARLRQLTGAVGTSAAQSAAPGAARAIQRADLHRTAIGWVGVPVRASSAA